MWQHSWHIPKCRQLPPLVCCFWDNAQQQAKIRILTFPLHLCHRDYTPYEGVKLCTLEVTHCWIVNLCLWPSLGGKRQKPSDINLYFPEHFYCRPRARQQSGYWPKKWTSPSAAFEKCPHNCQESLTWGGSCSEDHVGAGRRGGTAWRGPHSEHDSPRTRPASHGWSCHCNSIGSCWSWEITFQQVSPYSM